jgi:hypothetical protein
MIDQVELEHRVQIALRTKADQLRVRTGPFFEGSVERVDPVPARRRHRMVWSIAALATAACLLLGFWVATDRAAPRTNVVTTPAPPTLPTPELLGAAPTWTPAGLNLESLTATRQPASTGITKTTELFGSSDGQPQLLIDLQPGSWGDGVKTPLQVRGRSAREQSAKEFSATSTTLMWDEGAAVQATFSGMRLVQAQALLATLQWSSPSDHLAGFVPAATSTLTLLGQSIANAPAQPTTGLEFHYADHVSSQDNGQGLQLDVHTISARGGLTGDYLKAWFHGTRDAVGMVESFDPSFGTLSRIWPDGRTTWIDANATAVSQADERRVADEEAAITTADFSARLAQAAVTLSGELPRIASVDLAPGTIELRGNGTVLVVCIGPTGGTPTACSGPTTASLGLIVGSVLLDGNWYVLGASPTPFTVVENRQPSSTHSTTVPSTVIPLLTKTDAGWILGLANPPPGTDAVSVVVNQDSQGLGVFRPVA